MPDDGICPFAEWRPGVTAFGPGGGDKVGFCDHTAGGFYSTLRDPGFWNGHGYSVHFGISLKGDACQLVSIFDRAWGQGRLGPSVGWGRYITMGRRNPNEYLISTEHEDAITEGGRTRFLPPVWTPEMYAMDLRIKRWCIDEYKRVKGVDIMPFGIDSLCGHHMFDGVNRVNCPGPYWKNEYRDRLYRDLTQGEEVIMNRFNSFSPWYDSPANQEFNGKRGVNARMDFVGLPADAVAIEADIQLKDGSGPLVIYDHDEETQNASYAFTVPGTTRYMQGRVNLDPDNGWFHMVGENAKIARISIVGYYTR